MKVCMEGVLLKQPLRIEGIRMGRHFWRRRRFVLDDNSRKPFRYYHDHDAYDDVAGAGVESGRPPSPRPPSPTADRTSSTRTSRSLSDSAKAVPFDFEATLGPTRARSLADEDSARLEDAPLPAAAAPNAIPGGLGDEVHIVIDLYGVSKIELVAENELHLFCDDHKTHKLRAPDDAPAGTLRLWFDALLLKLDELRTQERPRSEKGEDETQGDEEALNLDHHLAWHQLPHGRFNKVLHVLVFPLKAAIHLTVPDVHTHRWAKWYPLALLLSVIWLAFLAFVMTLLLEQVGCKLNISSTVMGLTLGAIGTSFPNLYASILTARAGQGDQAICQAFGSNTFNVCIALGAVWLAETLAGSCAYGSYAKPHIAWCNGCYMPTGVLCPFLDNKGPELNAKGPELAAGSLEGTVVVCYFCFFVFTIALVCGQNRLTRCAAIVFLGIYVSYVTYEALAAYDFAELKAKPICYWGLCL